MCLIVMKIMSKYKIGFKYLKNRLNFKQNITAYFFLFTFVVRYDYVDNFLTGFVRFAQ